MRFHSHFLSIEALLSGTSVCTPKSLGLTLAGEFATRTHTFPYRTALAGAFVKAPPMSTKALTAPAMLELFRVLLHEQEHLQILFNNSSELEDFYKLLKKLVLSLPIADKDQYINQLTTLKDLEKSNHLLNLLEFYTIPYNDVWIRDTAPLFLTPVSSNGTSEPSKRGGAIIFRFNGWGEKYPYQQDAALARQFIQQLYDKGKLNHYEDFFLFETDFSCEGGAFESNGQGLALTTCSVILNPNRGNTHLSRPLNKSEAEHVLKEILGLHALLGLEYGLLDDDTDGHIDNVARFIDAQTVLVAVSPESELKSPSDSQLTPEQLAYEECLKTQLNANHNQLTDYNLSRPLSSNSLKNAQNSKKLEILTLPLPPPVYITEIASHKHNITIDKPLNKRLTQSYLNYLQLKDKIVMPSYDKSYEKALMPWLNKIFPKYEIVWIDWRKAIEEGGGPHCLTQHVPF